MSSDWTKIALGELLRLEYGKSLKEAHRSGDGFPVYGSNGEVGRHCEPLVNDAPVIVVGRKGSAGSVHWSGEPCWPIDTTYWVQLHDDRLSPHFAHLLLVHQRLEKISAQTGVPGLNRDRVHELRVQLPTLEEQRRIVDLVRTVDSLVASLDRSSKVAIAALSAVELDSASALPHRGARALGDVADVVGGVTKNKRTERGENLVEVPYLRVANVQRGFLDLAEVKTIRVPASRAEDRRLEPGDVLLTEGGDRDKLGRGWVWQGELPQCVHQNHVFRARVLDRSRFEPKFISIWANTFGQRWFFEHGGQTSGIASISLSKLRRFPIPDVSMEEQQRIVSATDGLRRLLKRVDAQRIAADRLRAALLDDLLSGRHRIPESYDALLETAS